VLRASVGRTLRVASSLEELMRLIESSSSAAAGDAPASASRSV
jgi:hypothetical protein